MQNTLFKICFQNDLQFAFYLASPLISGIAFFITLIYLTISIWQFYVTRKSKKRTSLTQPKHQLQLDGDDITGMEHHHHQLHGINESIDVDAETLDGQDAHEDASDEKRKEHLKETRIS